MFILNGLRKTENKLNKAHLSGALIFVFCSNEANSG